MYQLDQVVDNGTNVTLLIGNQSAFYPPNSTLPSFTQFNYTNLTNFNNGTSVLLTNNSTETNTSNGTINANGTQQHQRD